MESDSTPSFLFMYSVHRMSLQVTSRLSVQFLRGRTAALPWGLLVRASGWYGRHHDESPRCSLQEGLVTSTSGITVSSSEAYLVLESHHPLPPRSLIFPGQPTLDNLLMEHCKSLVISAHLRKTLKVHSSSRTPKESA